MSEQTEGRVPVAVWEGSFRLFGVDVRCYVLDDGQRIIHADDVVALFEAMGSGGAQVVDDADLMAFARWGKGVDRE